MSKYLIWSIEHRAWWKSMSMGYTDKVSEAGKYTREDAMQAVNAAHIAQSEDHIQEIAVRVEDLPTGVQKGVNHDN